MKGSYKNGDKEGDWISYFENGELRASQGENKNQRYEFISL